MTPVPAHGKCPAAPRGHGHQKSQKKHPASSDLRRSPPAPRYLHSPPGTIPTRAEWKHNPRSFHAGCAGRDAEVALRGSPRPGSSGVPNTLLAAFWSSTAPWEGSEATRLHHPSLFVCLAKSLFSHPQIQKARLGLRCAAGPAAPKLPAQHLQQHKGGDGPGAAPLPAPPGPGPPGRGGGSGSRGEGKAEREGQRRGGPGRPAAAACGAGARFLLAVARLRPAPVPPHAPVRASVSPSEGLWR